MPKGVERGASVTGVPPKFAETTPPVYRGGDFDFVLQGIFEIQKNVGTLNEAVTTLKTQGKEQGDKLDKLSHRIYAAAAVLTALGVILGFLLNKGVDLLIQLKGIAR